MQAAAPPRLRFSTDSVRPARRLPYWKETICEAFVRLDLDCDVNLPFHAALEARHMGRFDCIQVSASAQRVSRSRRLVDQDHSDNLILMRQRQGDCITLQGGLETHLRADGLALVDSRHPYTLQFPRDFSQTVFRVPAGILDHRLGRAALGTTGCVLLPGTALGRLACQALDQLEGEPRESVALPLSNIALDLLALALAEAAPDAATTPPMATMRVTWAKAQVLDNLRDPGLGPQAIAGRQGVSLRLLQRLFAADGESLGSFILEQRLQRCRDELRHPAQSSRSITEIALAWGFNDPAHFAKAFRRRFGIAPRDYRANPSHTPTASQVRSHPRPGSPVDK
jgi:AraC-like DNA-binding protein